MVAFAQQEVITTNHLQHMQIVGIITVVGSMECQVRGSSSQIVPTQNSRHNVCGSKFTQPITMQAKHIHTTVTMYPPHKQTQ